MLALRFLEIIIYQTPPGGCGGERHIKDRFFIEIKRFLQTPPTTFTSSFSGFISLQMNMVLGSKNFTKDVQKNLFVINVYFNCSREQLKTQLENKPDSYYHERKDVVFLNIL